MTEHRLMEEDGHSSQCLPLSLVYSHSKGWPYGELTPLPLERKGVLRWSQRQSRDQDPPASPAAARHRRLQKVAAVDGYDDETGAVTQPLCCINVP